MICRKHPRYRAILKPRADCQACRDMYAKAQTKKENT